ncbi:MAG TPA: MASE1 domain-containing protein [Caulobacterales bacterium]|nr:MASE1 domain-containing protein [Caulobacterales bacterium]
MTAAALEQTQRFSLVRVLEIVLAALAYFALARMSLLLASLNASATPVWPPTGFAIALVLLRGKPHLAAVFLGALGANYLTTPAWFPSTAIALGNMLEAYVGVLLIERLAQGARVFESPLGIAKFAAIAIGAAAPTSATVGVTALVAGGLAPAGQYLDIWATWWLGDLAGAILAAPALVLWTRSLQARERPYLRLATLATWGAAALIGALAFSPLSPAPASLRGAVAFLVVAPLLWSALKLGARDTAITALLLSSLAIWGVVAGASPFLRATLNDSLLLLVAFIVAATLPSLVLAAERRESQAMLDQTREELAQAQKLEALGQMTSGVAHDFNNLLSSVAGGLRILKRQDDERAKTIEALEQALARGGGLTKQLLSFARREPVQLRSVDVGEAIAEVEPLIRQSLPRHIAFTAEIGPALWRVRVDRAQLDLALLNLAANARDAMPNGGALTLRAENVVADDVRAVAITVTDTGQGMSPDVAARAFEPFFTTKPAGAGTGLGLAQVYGFAKQSGGRASIESARGEGASVCITLPKA